MFMKFGVDTIPESITFEWAETLTNEQDAALEL